MGNAVWFKNSLKDQEKDNGPNEDSSKYSKVSMAWAKNFRQGV